MISAKQSTAINAGLKSVIERTHRHAGKYSINAELDRNRGADDALYAVRSRSRPPGETISKSPVVIQGDWDKHTTLIGGIHSEYGRLQRLRQSTLLGAGKGNDELAGAGRMARMTAMPNVAFDGNSHGQRRADCTFTGYDIAIKCGTSLRMFGRYNTFTKQPHRVEAQRKRAIGDGNPDAQSCVFEEQRLRALRGEVQRFAPATMRRRYCTVY